MANPLNSAPISHATCASQAENAVGMRRSEHRAERLVAHIRRHRLRPHDCMLRRVRRDQRALTWRSVRSEHGDDDGDYKFIHRNPRCELVPVVGIEPTHSAYEAEPLPLRINRRAVPVCLTGLAVCDGRRCERDGLTGDDGRARQIDVAARSADREARDNQRVAAREHFRRRCGARA